MSVREDRLRAEHNAMKKFRSRVVTWETIGNSNPPDVYHFTYNLKSIISIRNGDPQYHKGFKIEVRFPPDYPRKSPEVRLISKPWPFHPNIWVQDGRFCLEGTQHWIPGIGVPLESICQMVGEIIAFQEVNLKSPANGDSALRDWVVKNLRIENVATVTNPVDSSPIRLPDAVDAIKWGGDDSSSKPAPRIKFG